LPLFIHETAQAGNPSQHALLPAANFSDRTALLFLAYSFVGSRQVLVRRYPFMDRCAAQSFFGFNFVPGKHEGFVWAGWIISVEMIFYLIFPFIYRYIHDLWRSLGFFFVTLIAAAGYAVFVRYLPIHDSQRESFLQFGFIHQLPIFALGMVAFFVYDLFIQDKSRPRSWAVALVAAAVIGYTALISGHLSILLDGIYWQGVIYGILLLGLAISPISLFVNRLTCFYGEISYSFYLNHPTLVFALIPVYRIIYAMHLPATLQYGACLLLTLVPLTLLSYCTYRFIEKPGICVGSRLIKRIVAS
jgi:peptidoglycan/LPS O-acetylase OafA/YrhL